MFLMKFLIFIIVDWKAGGIWEPVHCYENRSVIPYRETTSERTSNNAGDPDEWAEIGVEWRQVGG